MEKYKYYIYIYKMPKRRSSKKRNYSRKKKYNTGSRARARGRTKTREEIRSRRSRRSRRRRRTIKRGGADNEWSTLERGLAPETEPEMEGKLTRTSALRGDDPQESYIPPQQEEMTAMGSKQAEAVMRANRHNEQLWAASAQAQRKADLEATSAHKIGSLLGQAIDSVSEDPQRSSQLIDEAEELVIGLDNQDDFQTKTLQLILDNRSIVTDAFTKKRAIREMAMDQAKAKQQKIKGMQKADSDVWYSFPPEQKMQILFTKWKGLHEKQQTMGEREFVVEDEAAHDIREAEGAEEAEEAAATRLPRRLAKTRRGYNATRPSRSLRQTLTPVAEVAEEAEGAEGAEGDEEAEAAEAGLRARESLSARREVALQKARRELDTNLYGDDPERLDEAKRRREEPDADAGLRDTQGSGESQRAAQPEVRTNLLDRVVVRHFTEHGNSLNEIMDKMGMSATLVVSYLIDGEKRGEPVDLNMLLKECQDGSSEKSRVQRAINHRSSLNKKYPRHRPPPPSGPSPAALARERAEAEKARSQLTESFAAGMRDASREQRTNPKYLAQKERERAVQKSHDNDVARRNRLRAQKIQEERYAAAQARLWLRGKGLDDGQIGNLEGTLRSLDRKFDIETLESMWS